MKEKIIKSIWLFVIGSIIGYIFEAIVVILQEGHYVVRQGLIYGPFIPVYGIGGVMYYLVLSSIKFKENKKLINILSVFGITMILGGLTEYICSVVQEICFGTVSWDYTHLPFNLGGRTSLLHCSFWGTFGVAYYLLVEPLIKKADPIINNKITLIVTILIATYMIFNIVISSLACFRQYQRRKNIEATNPIQTYLDEHYPDEYLKEIYTNIRER